MQILSFGLMQPWARFRWQISARAFVREADRRVNRAITWSRTCLFHELIQVHLINR